MENLGTLLAKYCGATADQQNLLAKQIEKSAKSLLKKTPALNAAAKQESLRISLRERKILQRKAKEGDSKAADRLSQYYSVYRSDQKMALHYLKLGARKDSDAAIRKLMTSVQYRRAVVRF